MVGVGAGGSGLLVNTGITAIAKANTTTVVCSGTWCVVVCRGM